MTPWAPILGFALFMGLFVLVFMFRPKSKLLKVLSLVSAYLLVSLLLTIVSQFVAYQYFVNIETPGMFVARHLVSTPPPPNQLSTLGESIIVSWIVDVAFYLAMIVSLFSVIRRYRVRM